MEGVLYSRFLVLYFWRGGNLLINAMFQDDNFSLSLLNELSVKYGIQTHLSHAPLPQKLEELREYLRREIKKELKVASSEMIILF